MNITVKPYLLKRRKRKDGTIPVYIRITQNGKYSLLSAKIAVKASQWDDKAEYGKWIQKHPSKDAWNYKLKKKIIKIEKTIHESGDNITRKQVVRQVKGTSEGEFYDHAKSFYEKLEHQGKFHPYKQTKAAVSKFERFTGKKVKFSEITPALLNEFQDWMKTELGNHNNTIIKTISRIQAIVKDACKKSVTDHYPFNDPNFERVKSVDSKKKALSMQQIEAIEDLRLKPGSTLWHTRNYFMFSFWCFGIRFTDLALLRWENIIDGRLIYIMGKSKSGKPKEKNIKLLPEAKRILEYYSVGMPSHGSATSATRATSFIFPILPDQKLTELGYKKKAASQNVIINRSLKKIAKKAAIKINVTFHTSRHSFSRWARENKMDIDFIGAALSHSKRSTTEKYLNSLSEYNLDEEAELLAQTRRGKK